MKRISVISSAINSIGYDAETGILEIEFAGGNAYQYYDVPHHVYDEMMHAESLGAYVNEAIVRGGYAYQEKS
ncbi:MAG: KTSC domain-containing protein [Burkholderiales bacterium]|nr:KTSC domain-containing protein [Burkholderiales bacterium]MDQ3196202.1 KTSC domain-containing protein [Pseudomonadota bacterium]